MQTVQDASVNWVRTHIVELWPGEQQPSELAESLVAMAVAQAVPIEQVIEWLHEQHAADSGPVSSAAFHRSRQDDAR